MSGSFGVGEGLGSEVSGIGWYSFAESIRRWGLEEAGDQTSGRTSSHVGD
jgi:hypothetical protein